MGSRATPSVRESGWEGSRSVEVGQLKKGGGDRDRVAKWDGGRGRRDGVWGMAIGVGAEYRSVWVVRVGNSWVRMPQGVKYRVTGVGSEDGTANVGPVRGFATDEYTECTTDRNVSPPEVYAHRSPFKKVEGVSVNDNSKSFQSAPEWTRTCCDTTAFNRTDYNGQSWRRRAANPTPENN
ncbi:hypothetical protein BYT27DRAFT_7209154 [Phlegmacium glaucopus]|nr:hypothetical protein BYT27DRAFT_7209154 [Phlegmacium glaucopus]